MVKKLFMLLLIALGVGLAVPSTRAEINRQTVVRARDYIGMRLDPGRLEAMANQIDVRVGRAEGLPGDFQAWIRRDYTGPERDSWGTPWYIGGSRGIYIVGSAGPDRERGTADDITVTRRLPQERR